MDRDNKNLIDFADIVLCFETLRHRDGKRAEELDKQDDRFNELISNILCRKSALTQLVARQPAQPARNSMNNYTYDCYRLYRAIYDHHREEGEDQGAGIRAGIFVYHDDLT